MTVAVSLALLLAAAAVAAVRLFRGPTIADRVIALDVMLVTLMSAIAVRAADQQSTLPIGTLAALAIIAFTATVALTRSIERSDSA